MADIDINRIFIKIDGVSYPLSAINGKAVSKLSIKDGNSFNVVENDTATYKVAISDESSYIETVSSNVSSYEGVYAFVKDESILTTDNLLTFQFYVNSLKFIPNGNFIAALFVDNDSYDSTQITTSSNGSVDAETIGYWGAKVKTYMISSDFSTVTEITGEDATFMEAYMWTIILMLAEQMGLSGTAVANTTAADLTATLFSIDTETFAALNDAYYSLFDDITIVPDTALCFAIYKTYISIENLKTTDADGNEVESDVNTVYLSYSTDTNTRNSNTKINIAYQVISMNDGSYIQSKEEKDYTDSGIKLLTNSTLKLKVKGTSSSSSSGGSSGDTSGDGSVCLTGDTLITLFDGTTKRLDEIKVGDKVLSINRKGKQVIDTVIYSDAEQKKTSNCFMRYTMSDGGHVDIVIDHRFYDIDKHRYPHMSKWNWSNRLLTANNTTPTVVSKQIFPGEVRHYTIMTKKYCNYFANGYLAGHRKISRVLALIRYFIWRHKHGSN